MRILVHKMKGCQLCKKCIALLNHWGIPFNYVYDNPRKDRQYPYITIECEYTELVEMISKEVF